MTSTHQIGDKDPSSGKGNKLNSHWDSQRHSSNFGSTRHLRNTSRDWKPAILETKCCWQTSLSVAKDGCRKRKWTHQTKQYRNDNKLQHLVEVDGSSRSLTFFNHWFILDPTAKPRRLPHAPAARARNSHPMPWPISVTQAGRESQLKHTYKVLNFIDIKSCNWIQLASSEPTKKYVQNRVIQSCLHSHQLPSILPISMPGLFVSFAWPPNPSVIPPAAVPSSFCRQKIPRIMESKA